MAYTNSGRALLFKSTETALLIVRIRVNTSSVDVLIFFFYRKHGYIAAIPNFAIQSSLAI